MKKILIMLILFFANNLEAQTPNPIKIVLDTIEVSRIVQTYLTFPNEIKKINTNLGSRNLNIENPESFNAHYVLSVNANRKFLTEDITMIDNNSTYYNIHVIYSDKKPDKIFYFFGGIQNIVTENRENAEDVIVTEEDKKYLKDKKVYYATDTLGYKEEARRLNSLHTSKIKRIYISNNSIYFSLIGTYSRVDKLYLRFEIRNKSAFPFDISQIKFLLSESSKNWSVESNSDKEIYPIFEYNKRYGSVLPGKTMHRTFVFDKFRITTKKGELKVILSEQEQKEDGAPVSNYFIPIPKDYINNPINLSKGWDKAIKDQINAETEEELNEKPNENE
ncbi:MAG: conjugative transposon protein TraN [Endomicrobium sp.]|jgi:hypothetical protein|nr:conjugative transposon protein TraN [Endomicrobium sp.]